MNDVSEDLVEPIHAQSFFSVSINGEIHERLSFEYLDPNGYYRSVIQDTELLRREILKLSTNMQNLLDSERVEINGTRVRSLVNFTDIYLSGESEVVSVIFIIDFAKKFVSGKNIIETWLESEISPYDFEIIWRFPVGTEIVTIDTLLDYEIYRDLVSLWALEGDHVGEYEKMEFILPEHQLDTTYKIANEESNDAD